MKRLLTLILLCITFASFSQERTLYNTSQQKKLKDLSSEISSQQSLTLQNANKLATEKKWKTDGHLRNDRTFKLMGLDATGHPLYLATESNAKAAITTRTNLLYAGGSLGLSLSGNSSSVINKLGVWDGGGVLTTHQELTSRVTQQDKVSGTEAHSTHVAGTMVAQGVAALAKGMAFGANLKAWDYNSDATEMANAASNLLISNHSYGYLAGWSYDSDLNAWVWYGNTSISQYEDYKFGFYDSNTQAWDKIAYNAPYYLIVKSAGNNRGETGPEAGETYYLASSNDTSKVVRSKNDGYDIIATTSTAKNILTVGAVNGTNGVAPLQSSDIQMSSFSSWGPTDDGRIKPDIVAVGVDILSSTNTSTSSYAVYSGTSMASPQAAGSILLLQELYAKQNDGLLMRSSTLKGLVIHTADDAGNEGPDYIYGWGLLNMEKAAKAILNTDKTYSITERTLATGQTYTQKIVASGKETLTATICWTDPEGTATTVSASNLNNRTPKLINDLDIKISDGTNNYLPFVLDPDRPSVVASKGDNIRDNVEQILIPDAMPGKTYTITISHKNTLKNTSQDYALILSGIGGTEYCASTPVTIQDNIESVKIGDLTSGYTVSSSQQIPLEIMFKSTNAKNTLVYIDWNMNGVFDEKTELVASALNLSGALKATINVPAGLTIGSATLMRIVSSDNVPLSNLASCGTYVEGVTKDYKITYVRPANDLAVTALVTPESSNFCVSSTGTVSVSLKNLGTKPQKNVVVSVKISTESGTLTTLTGTYQDSIKVFSEVTLALNGTFNAKAGSNYVFEVNVTLAGDQDLSNNTQTYTRQISVSPTPTTAQAIICEGASTLTVSGTSSSTLLWYDAQTDGNLLFTGNSGNFTKPDNLSKVYVGINDINTSFGPKDKYTFGGGTYYDNFGPEPIIVTQTPLVIESARVYVGTSGKITFTIYRLSDSTPISSVTFDVTATRTNSNATRSNGQLIDDTTDQGVVLPLNLAIPAAGTYVLSQECTNGASIYRSNLNANSTVSGADIAGYPFNIPNVISITGALFNGSSIKTGYYYTYDMKIKSYGCPSNRAEVAITTKAAPKASVTPSSNFSICLNDTKTISASTGTNYTYQWLLNGSNIAGAISSTYNVGQAGSFSVKVTENGLCSATSSAVVASVYASQTPQLTLSGATLSLSSGSNPSWYYNGNLMSDATTSSIVPLASGVYQAKVTDTNGCTVYSSSYVFTITAVEDEVVTDEIAKIFPNPAREKFKVEYADPQNNPKYVFAELINIIGIPVSSQELVKSKGVYTGEFDVSRETAGKFFIRLTSDKATKVIPLVVSATN
ncbi:S8 family serine peptidase [Arcicella rigui]|uniref:S8 family serine peptidase n=1 Tax=Arcicella rigui TaxID=797020 RepID=A0ABU5QBQ9_9BACT|nr:S8 family serine peptidase [Arcicella rigui]MEA5140261.1 S8 family serine peptidase [Arcicella rigui]